MPDAARHGRRSRTRGRTAPTVADVAALAGVSPMTVSRVVNGAAGVRAATRAAVEEAIAALDYAPNAAARSLAGGRPVRIGLLYDNPSQGFLGELLVGILDQARLVEVQITVEQCATGRHDAEAIRRLIESGVDGVVLPPPLCEAADVLEVLHVAGIAAVSVATARPAGDAWSIGIDDRHAAHEMTRHILALGHRRIGHIAGNPDLSASALRFEGYRAALDEAGIAFDAALVVPGLFTYRSGLDGAERLLAITDPPTAIFAANDDMAAAAVAVAHRRGLEVPGDLSVCGFDDTAVATTIWPELTTIRQPIAAMARAAVDRLVHAVRRPREAPAGDRHLLFDHRLCRRHSDGAPRRA